MSISALSSSMAGWSTGRIENLFASSNGQAAKKTPIAAQEKTEVAKEPTAAEEFLKWSKMNPVERIRAQYLKDNDLTEEELASMPAEERAKIEDEIRKLIEEKLTGEEKLKASGNLKIDV